MCPKKIIKTEDLIKDENNLMEEFGIKKHSPGIKKLRQMKDHKAKTIEEAMKGLLEIDTDKLRLLADYMDMEQKNGRWGGQEGSYEVQEDLRRWAQAIDDVVEFNV